MRRILWLVVPILLLIVYFAIRPPSVEIEQEERVSTRLPELSRFPSGVDTLEEISISILPETIIQGEPVLIVVDGISSLAEVKFLAVNGIGLGLFLHEGKPSALIGIDLRGRVGTYPIALTLRDGEKINKNLIVTERRIVTVPLGIPEKLGGDTPEAEQELIETLIQEAAIINSIPSVDEKLWEGEFRFPVDPPVIVTDTYGYSRQTGGSSISHKGTDFRANVGTPVYAMNSGTVRFARALRNYGNTVIIDHGFGLHTVYMHLSELNVELEEEVEKGELIGRSGDSGYVLGPHLHLSVRINAISIDPMKFMEIFGEKIPDV